jgi:ubiquinone biosynthesis accessory factor UbiK
MFLEDGVVVDKHFFDDLANRLANAVPPGVKSLQDDLERNFRGLLQSGFAKLDLVTREEFDVQTRVLERTRQKLTALEQELQSLQQQIAEPVKPKVKLD